MIYMFLSNNPSSGDINLSNLSCSHPIQIKLCISIDDEHTNGSYPR